MLTPSGVTTPVEHLLQGFVHFVIGLFVFYCVLVCWLVLVRVSLCSPG